MQGGAETRKEHQPLRPDSRRCAAAFRRTRLRQCAAVRRGRSVRAHESWSLSSLRNEGRSAVRCPSAGHGAAASAAARGVGSGAGCGTTSPEVHFRTRTYVGAGACHRTVDPRGAATGTGPSCRDQEIVASRTQHPARQHCRTSVGGPLPIRHRPHACRVCGYRHDQLDSVLVRSHASGGRGLNGKNDAAAVYERLVASRSTPSSAATSHASVLSEYRCSEYRCTQTGVSVMTTARATHRNGLQHGEQLIDEAITWATRCLILVGDDIWSRH
jgi:hypothetical protein